jgi:hypothetical protein
VRVRQHLWPSPLLALFPGLVILPAIAAHDCLRDALDPKTGPAHHDGGATRGASP